MLIGLPTCGSFMRTRWDTAGMSGRHRKPRSHAAGRHRRPPGPSRWLAPGLVVVALLGAGGVGAHAALTDSGASDPSAPPAAARAPSPAPASTSPSAAPVPAATSAPPAPPAVHHARQVALQLAITGSVSWIDVRRPSGHVLASGMFRHGRRLSYAHGPLRVVIGNAAAVTLTRAGVTRKAGHPGEVVKLTVE